MSTPDQILKRNDTAPALLSTLEYDDGTQVDLTGCSVLFFMRLQGGSTNKVNGVATVVSATTGLVQYNWTASDTNTSGAYVGEFQVTTSSAATLSFPNSGYLFISIIDDLG